MGQDWLFCEVGDLSFLLCFSKQSLVGNAQRKIFKKSSVIFIPEESPKLFSPLGKFG